MDSSRISHSKTGAPAASASTGIASSAARATLGFTSSSPKLSAPSAARCNSSGCAGLACIVCASTRAARRQGVNHGSYGGQVGLPNHDPVVCKLVHEGGKQHSGRIVPAAERLAEAFHEGG
eukprot:scaffold3685_cov102-Isochrysis_galbana.AAC.13